MITFNFGFFSWPTWTNFFLKSIILLLHQFMTWFLLSSSYSRLDVTNAESTLCDVGTVSSLRLTYPSTTDSFLFFASHILIPISSPPKYYLWSPLFLNSMDIFHLPFVIFVQQEILSAIPSLKFYPLLTSMTVFPTFDL